jgi:hypothetical protein
MSISEDGFIVLEISSKYANSRYVRSPKKI